MRILRWVALALGLVAIVALVLGSGIDQLKAALARGGFKLISVPVFMLVPLLINAKGWQVLVRRAPPLKRFVYARWIGESINSLLPVAQIGGLVVKSYLLGKNGLTPAFAMASTLVAVTLSVASLLVFVVFGLILMVLRNPHAKIVLPLAVAVAVFSLPVYLFFHIQRHGVKILPRPLRARAAALTGLGEHGGALMGHIQRIYADAPHVWLSFLLHLCGWLIGSGEIWLSVYLLGGKLSVLNALILESLGQAVRNVAFVVPGALGLQEGAYLLAGPALGLVPALALSISLIKRFRELALGLPGLATWQLNEGWSALRAARGIKR